MAIICQATIKREIYKPFLKEQQVVRAANGGSTRRWSRQNIMIEQNPHKTASVAPANRRDHPFFIIVTILEGLVLAINFIAMLFRENIGDVVTEMEK